MKTVGCLIPCFLLGPLKKKQVHFFCQNSSGANRIHVNSRGTAGRLSGPREAKAHDQERRHVFWVGGAGLHERSHNTKRPKVSPPKAQNQLELGDYFCEMTHLTNE